MKQKGFAPISVIFIIAIIIVVVYFFKNQNLSFQTTSENYSVEDVETLIDENKTSWKEYSDETISFKYPLYLSDFRDISADTELAQKGEKIATYLRKTKEGEVSGSGRSYWIILTEAYPNTKGKDVLQWINSTKENLITDESGKPLPVETKEIFISGKSGYQVSLKPAEQMASNQATTYFQTSEGIRSIGLFTFGSGESLTKNWNIYQEILASVNTK